MAKRITKSEETQIIELYKSGMTAKEVSKEVGKSSSSVLRVLKRNNEDTRKQSDHKVSNKFELEKELDIVSLYVEDGWNTVQIAEKYNTYNTSIRRVLLRYNVQLRGPGIALRKIELEDIESKKNTREFDYFLGLLATDGCVTDNRIVLDFSEENKELLHYWNEFLGNKCNITCHIHKVFQVPQYRIAFRNQEVVDFLESYGITPNKTFSIILKYINWDVLRGIIDGDGCVSVTNKGTTLKVGITSANKKFLEQIQQFLLEYSIQSFLNESDRNESPIYDLFVYKSDDIIKMYEHLYKNAHFFLKRKELKFGPLLEKFNKCSLVNSGKEMCNSNPEPSLKEEGVETLHEVPKEKN